MSGYQPISQWRIPRSVVPATLRGIMRAGHHGRESGAFWLGRRSSLAEIQSVALLQGEGVTEERGYWEVSPLVYGAVGEWAGARDQVLLAVVHSHDGSRSTWMSGLDQRDGVRVPDMLAVIVPGLGSVPELESWGFHRFNKTRFVEIDPKAREMMLTWTDTEVTVVRASEAGVVDV